MKTTEIAATFAMLLFGAGARAGTVTVQGDQTVAGSQTVQSNQTVAGALTSQGTSAEVAATRFRAFGPVAGDTWIKIARIGGADLTNAVVAGRVLAQGNAPGQQYVADFAFPGTGQTPYAPVLVEMGGATSFLWVVTSSEGNQWLWFKQSGGSKFANFLYGQSGCEPVWEVTTSGNPPGIIWTSTSSASSRQRVKAGGMTLTSGLTLPDGTILSARSNMTATALVNPANYDQRLAEVIGGRLVFSGGSDFVGGIGLGTNGAAITAERWAAVESALVAGDGAKGIGSAAGWSIAGMAESASGDRYAYGSFAGTLAACGTLLPSGASENDRAGFVIKFDPVGRMAWARAFALVGHSTNGAQNESLVQVARGAVDASNNVLLAGTFRAAADFAGLTNSPSGGGDGFVVSLRPDGTPAWFRQFGGAEAAADTLVDLELGAGGTNLVAGGARAVSGGTAGRAVTLASASGSTLGEWAIAEPVSQVCFLGTAPAAAWGSTAGRLGAGGWSNTLASAVGDLMGTPSGDAVVFEPEREGVGAVTLLSGATGAEQWSEVGYSYGSGSSYEVYDEFYNWLGTQYYGESHWWALHDVAVDRSGNVWLAWDGSDSSYESGPLYNWSYSNEYHDVGRRGGDFVDSGGQVSLLADASGDIHALGYAGGAARDVRFDGQTGAQESDSRVDGASGDLVGVSSSGQSLIVAAGGSIAQSSPWGLSLAVDGLVSADSGIRLGDGTLVNSGEDIAALGPVQATGGGGYFLSGNLGVGTNAPSARLDVEGAARVSGTASLLGNVAVGGDLTVAGAIVAGGTARAMPAGDVPMGAFTNGPAQ
ncbi:MAG TPA: hypothetical protein PLU30_26380 [Verrucomicrobiae bacterium]|nr:hypothetical protein [Verrucomicrobiae bacterium]